MGVLDWLTAISGFGLLGTILGVIGVALYWGARLFINFFFRNRG